MLLVPRSTQFIFSQPRKSPHQATALQVPKSGLKFDQISAVQLPNTFASLFTIRLALSQLFSAWPTLLRLSFPPGFYLCEHIHRCTTDSNCCSRRTFWGKWWPWWWQWSCRQRQRLQSLLWSPLGCQTVCPLCWWFVLQATERCTMKYTTSCLSQGWQ